MKKTLTLALVCAFLLSCFSACTTESKTINPEAVFQHLLTDIQYDTDLIDAGELSSVYFTGLPTGATVRLHISSTGYYADEVALITLAGEADAEAAKAIIQSHLDQVYNQFQNYIPEELPKIQSAVTWQSGSYIFVVIAPDASEVNALLEKAHTFTTAATQSTTTQAPTTEPATTATPTTEAPTTVPPTTEAPTTVPPTTKAPETEPSVQATDPDDPLAGYPSTDTPDGQVPVLISESGTYYIYPSGVVRVDNAAYEPYGYDANVAATYAGMVSTVADALAGIANVYCMPIPTAISVTFPDDVRERYPKSCDQGPQIDDIFSKMSSNVIGINCHGNLMLHRDEYLYFRTDYHWNGPAAYYAYESFCSTKGITPYTMEEREVTYFDGFLGTLYYSHSNGDPLLFNTPDVVVAYHPVSKSATMFYHDANGNPVPYPIIQDVSAWPSNSKYLCFAAADQAYAEFHNPEVTDGSALVLIKESYGNVLLSYLVDHYSTIYEIDYRYWNGNIVEFVQSVGANDVLFANNMTMISAGVLVGMLGTIIP